MTTVPQSIPLTKNRFLAELRTLWWITVKNWFYLVRYPSFIIQLLIWPLIFPAAYIVTAQALAGPDRIGLVYFAQNTGTADYIAYIVIGTTVWMWQNTVLWNIGTDLRNEQKRGTLESNWLSPSFRFSLLMGTTFIHLFTMFVFILVSFLEFTFLFGVRWNGDPGLVLLVFLCAAPSIYGIGITFASFVIRMQEANSFVQLVRGLVMIFCGITFPISILPDWMAQISRWLPQTYLIRAVRNAALDNAGFTALKSDLGALLIFGALWVLVGFLSFHWMERQARKSGIIGQY
jgi:ABC-2 type transport system permease protein